MRWDHSTFRHIRYHDMTSSVVRVCNDDGRLTSSLSDSRHDTCSQSSLTSFVTLCRNAPAPVFSRYYTVDTWVDTWTSTVSENASCSHCHEQLQQQQACVLASRQHAVQTLHWLVVHSRSSTTVLSLFYRRNTWASVVDACCYCDCTRPLWRRRLDLLRTSLITTTYIENSSSNNNTANNST